MSLSDLAAVGSLISGIAVFLSFIFLSLQLRQANRNQRSLMQQARTGRNVQILLKMADHNMSEMLAQASAERGHASISGASTPSRRMRSGSQRRVSPSTT